MTDIYRVHDGSRYEDFDFGTILKMKNLGLVRFYGSTKHGPSGKTIMNYRPAPRTRRVTGKKW